MDFKEEILEEPAEARCQAGAQGHSKTDLEEAGPQHQAAEHARVGTECHPDAELRDPLPSRHRHQSIDADSGQEKSGESEDCEEPLKGVIGPAPSGQNPLYRLDVEHHREAVATRDLAPDGRRQEGRVSIRSERDEHRAPRNLAQGKVDRGCVAGFFDRPHQEIRNDADDRHPGRARRHCELNSHSFRMLSLQEAAHEALEGPSYPGREPWVPDDPPPNCARPAKGALFYLGGPPNGFAGSNSIPWRFKRVTHSCSKLRRRWCSS